MEKPEHFYYSGCAFGKFQRLLADYPSATLGETIPNFHNTASRYRDFEQAVKENASGRADEVREEIAFIRARAADCSILTDLLAKGELPLRVTHNDTKLNNVMLDDVTAGRSASSTWTPSCRACPCTTTVTACAFGPTPRRRTRRICPR